LRKIFLAHGDIAFFGGLLSALAIQLFILWLPGCQAIHLAVVHAESGCDEHSIVDLDIRGSGFARFFHIGSGHVLAATLHFARDHQQGL
jgi:branched-subunit amino acid ABC-type transport system permease component